MSLKDENYWQAVLSKIKKPEGYHCPLCGFLTQDYEAAKQHQVGHMLNIQEIMAQIFKQRSTGLGKSIQKEAGER